MIQRERFETDVVALKDLRFERHTNTLRQTRIRTSRSGELSRLEVMAALPIAEKVMGQFRFGFAA
jgi:hypothetical protein